MNKRKGSWWCKPFPHEWWGKGSLSNIQWQRGAVRYVRGWEKENAPNEGLISEDFKVFNAIAT